MPWYAFPLIAPCLVVVVTVLVVAIRPNVSKNLAEVLRELPPILAVLVPRLKFPDKPAPSNTAKENPESYSDSAVDPSGDRIERPAGTRPSLPK